MQVYIRGEERIKHPMYCVQDVCEKSHTWNVVINQSEHSDSQTFGACVRSQRSIVHV